MFIMLFLVSLVLSYCFSSNNKQYAYFDSQVTWWKLGFTVVKQ